MALNIAAPAGSSYDAETGFWIDSGGVLYGLPPAAPKLAVAAPKVTVTGSGATLAVKVSPGVLTLAQQWANAQAMMQPAQINAFGVSPQWLPGFPVNAAFGYLPGYRTVWLGGASSGIDNKDAIIAALKAAGALYDPSVTDAYARAWYVPEAKAASIPAPTNRDNKAGGIMEKVVIGVIGAIATAGVAAAMSGTAQAAAGASVAAPEAESLSAILESTGNTLAPGMTYEQTVAAGLEAGAQLAESVALPSALDIAKTAAQAADTLKGSTVDESLADIMADTGNSVDYEWAKTYEQTIADGLQAGNELATTAAAAASGGNSPLADIINNAVKTFKTIGAGVAAIGGAGAALTTTKTGGTAIKPPNTVGTLGRIDLGTVALALGAFFLLRG